MDIINKIIEKIESLEENYFGLRVLREKHEDDMIVGSMLRNSRHQTDDMEEPEFLDGACALSVNEDVDHIKKVIDQLKNYPGKRVALVSAGSEEYGWDLYETILKNAKVEWIFDKELLEKL